MNLICQNNNIFQHVSLKFLVNIAFFLIEILQNFKMWRQKKLCTSTKYKLKESLQTNESKDLGQRM